MPTRCTMPFENFRNWKRRSAPMPTSSSSREARCAPFADRAAEDPREVDEQFLGRQVVVEVRVLGQEANPATDGDIADRLAQDLGVPRGGINQLHQQLQGGGLTGPVRAEEAEHFALSD